MMRSIKYSRLSSIYSSDKADIMSIYAPPLSEYYSKNLKMLTQNKLDFSLYIR
ncbi:MAG: hypothetical protein R3Y46_00970 [Opitutales bacterium]